MVHPQTSAVPIGIGGALRQVLDTAGVGGLWRGWESYLVLAWWPALEIAAKDPAIPLPPHPRITTPRALFPRRSHRGSWVL